MLSIAKAELITIIVLRKSSFDSAGDELQHMWIMKKQLMFWNYLLQGLAACLLLGNEMGHLPRNGKVTLYICTRSWSFILFQWNFHGFMIKKRSLVATDRRCSIQFGCCFRQLKYLCYSSCWLSSAWGGNLWEWLYRWTHTPMQYDMGSYCQWWIEKRQPH